MANPATIEPIITHSIVIPTVRDFPPHIPKKAKAVKADKAKNPVLVFTKEYQL